MLLESIFKFNRKSLLEVDENSLVNIFNFIQFFKGFEWSFPEKMFFFTSSNCAVF